jgi:hypothetical protein
MKLRAHGSAMGSTTQECARDEDGDGIEAVVGEGVHAKDDLVEVIVDEASHGVYQARGHVGDDSMRQ